MTAQLVDVVSAALLTTLAVMSLRSWSRDRKVAGLWLVLTFSVLALVTVAGVVLPDERRSEAAEAFLRAELVLLALLPFMLHRFASTFQPSPRALELGARALTALACVAVLLVDRLPADNEPFTRSLAFAAAALLLQWLVLLVSVASRLWQGGRDQPAVARQRMRLLSIGAVGILVTIALAALVRSSAIGDLLTGIVLILSAMAFYAGYLPPRALLAMWQSGTHSSIRAATIALMETEQRQDLSTTFLSHIAGLVGARAAAMINADGTLIGAWGVTRAQVELARTRDPKDTAGAMLAVDVPFGQILLWTSPYTPFFGTEELDEIRSMGAIIELALARHATLDEQRTLAQQLVKVNELKNEFVAVVAHDLRSPMSVIAGFAHTLDNQWDFMPDDKKREILRIIASSTESLALLVEDVLQVARIESGNMRYDKRPFDALQLIERVARDMRALRQHQIDVDADPNLPPAFGDPERYWQVLTNLVSNAMKFSPDEQPVTIQARSDGDAGTITVAVEDRGIGISHEDQNTVFEKFARVTPVDGTERAKGTGLGLFICKTIVDAHGGELSIRSSPGNGSTFTFTIPTAQDACNDS